MLKISPRAAICSVARLALVASRTAERPAWAQSRGDRKVGRVIAKCPLFAAFEQWCERGRIEVDLIGGILGRVGGK